MLEAMFVVSIVVEIGLPIVLAVWAVKKLGVAWGVIGMGAIAFVFSQLVHIPLLGALKPVLQIPAITGLPAGTLAIVTGAFYGILAGLCEEPSRWLAFKFLHERGQKPNNAVALGIGHGGIESVLFVGISVLSNFVVMLLIRAGSLNIPQITPDMVTQYFSMPWHIPLAGAVERVSTIALHIGMSMMVWKSIRHSNWKWLAGAILVHAVYDGAAVAMVRLGVTTWIVEAVFVVLGALSVYWVVYSLKTETPLEIEEGQPA